MRLFLSILFFTILLYGGDGHRYTNRLIDEDSPYLQQHAHNPVGLSKTKR